MRDRLLHREDTLGVQDSLHVDYAALPKYNCRTARTASTVCRTKSYDQRGLFTADSRITSSLAATTTAFDGGTNQLSVVSVHRAGCSAPVFRKPHQIQSQRMVSSVVGTFRRDATQNADSVRTKFELQPNGNASETKVQGK